MIYGIDNGMSVVHFHKVSDAFAMAEKDDFYGNLYFLLLDEYGNEIKRFLLAEKRELTRWDHGSYFVDRKGKRMTVEHCGIDTITDILRAIGM